MSTVYLIALVGFAAVMLGVLFEAVAGVSRKPVWHSHVSSIVDALPLAPALVEQPALAVAPAAIVEEIAVMAVDARHSGFAGLTNNEDFQLKA